LSRRWVVLQTALAMLAVIAAMATMNIKPR
jgi:hypothetical protein